MAVLISRVLVAAAWFLIVVLASDLPALVSVVAVVALIAVTYLLWKQDLKMKEGGRLDPGASSGQ